MEARARVAAASGDHEGARRLLEPVLRRPGMTGASPLWPVAGLAAEIEGDRASAAPQSGTAAAPVALVSGVVEELPRTGPYLDSWYRHARADLARARRDDTSQAWAGVCEGWQAVGHQTNLARAAYRLADVLAHHDEREEAAAPLSRAWQIADRIGAVPLRDLAVALSRSARIPIDPGPGRTRDAERAGGRLAALTEREVEVLRHVASGMSNNEIAAALFISPKTASVHVSRILTKLRVTTRTTATTVALEEGLDVIRLG